MSEPVLPHGWQAERFCYVATTGRVTGRIHEIEIWFAAHGGALYLLAGGGERSDWVANIMRSSHVGLRVAGATVTARARVVDDPAEAALARRLVPDKYANEEDGLVEWAATALPVAVELQ